jgi:hypothetical protein
VGGKIRLGLGVCAGLVLAGACSLNATGVGGGSLDAGSDGGMLADGLARPDAGADAGTETSDVVQHSDHERPDGCTDTMTDPDNCGSCGHSCLGGSCSDGVCQPKVIATTTGKPQAIAVQTAKSTLYWTDIASANSPFSCSLPDCPTAIASGGASGCNMSLGLAVDDASYSFTCWTNSWFYNCSSPASCASTLPIQDVSANENATPAEVNPSGITVDPSGTEPGIYFLAQQNNPGGGMHTGAVLYEPFDASGPGLTYFQTGQNFPSGIAKVGAELFWTETSGNLVASCMLSGSPPTCGATYKQILPGAHVGLNIANPDQLVANDHAIFFTVNGTMPMNFTDGAVYQASPDGTSIAALAMRQPYPRGIAIDAAYVYWVDYVSATSTTGTVNRVPIGGGTVTTLATGLSSPVGIAVDSTAIYWTNQGDGTVSRLAK